MPAFLRARDVNIILCYNQFGIHVFGFQGLVFMKRDKIKTQIMAYYIEEGYIAAMERGGSREKVSMKKLQIWWSKTNMNVTIRHVY